MYNECLTKLKNYSKNRDKMEIEDGFTYISIKYKKITAIFFWCLLFTQFFYFGVPLINDIRKNIYPLCNDFYQYYPLCNRLFLGGLIGDIAFMTKTSLVSWLVTRRVFCSTFAEAFSVDDRFVSFYYGGVIFVI